MLTIGRQELLYIRPKELHLLFQRNGIDASLEEVRRCFTEEGGYCEPLLKLIGAASVESLDISSFEGASILHDMNQLLPETYHEKFSVVFDGGSLEHVFQFPTAIQNCMNAVRLGGHFIAVSPANNLMGHGFYQFSPELLFRVFAPVNGFEIVNLADYEWPWRSNYWYEVADPDQVQSRVVLTNRRPVYSILWAKRTAVVPLFAQPPQQSDYAVRWRKSAGSGDQSTHLSRHVSFYRRHAPQWARSIYQKVRPFGSRFYKKVYQ